MKDQAQIETKIAELEAQANPAQTLAFVEVARTIATQALQWALEIRPSIYGEK